MSLHKQCRSLQGTAGSKGLLLLEEAKCNEKTLNSKVAYMTGTKPSKPASLVIPEPASTSGSNNDFQVAVCCNAFASPPPVDSAQALLARDRVGKRPWHCKLRAMGPSPPSQTTRAIKSSSQDTGLRRSASEPAESRTSARQTKQVLIVQ